MSKKKKPTPPFPPCYRAIDPRSKRSLFLSDDYEETRRVAEAENLSLEIYEPGYYEDDWHPKGMWFLIHTSGGKLPQA